MPGARDDEPGCEHGRDLEADADSAAGCASCRSASDERRERRWERDRAQVIEGGPLGALAPLEGRTALALAQVGSERASFSARELAALQSREGLLGVVAGQAALELLAERAAGAEHQGLDRGDRDVEHLGDLGVGAAFELAHDEGGALVEGEEAEGAAELGRSGHVGALGRRGGERIVELDLARAARRVAEALAADVVRDLDQPVVGCARALASLERAVRVEEGGLGGVLGVGLVLEDGQGVAVDGVDVLAVEPLEGAVGGWAACFEERGHRRLDAVRAPFLRFAPGHGCRLVGRARAARLGRRASSCSHLAQTRNSFGGRLEAGWRVELSIPSQGGDVGVVVLRRFARERSPSPRERSAPRSLRWRGASGADGSPARARRDPLP